MQLSYLDLRYENVGDYKNGNVHDHGCVQCVHDDGVSDDSL